ncbi:MAG: hypothetical protein AUK36_09820 [Zetaproteobacteria bacterium CG2_30_59_37]|nr:MAG: hypothetical protein AUK36_09820 [Zetaproteobacteria bacterium CG2_30_59_37]
MRKFFSLMMALSIVVVSSIPLVPLASACPPAHASAMQSMDDMQGTAKHQDDQHSAMQAAAGHIDVPAGEACVECGCGCHDSIDSLPHMLAPHSPDTASLSCAQSSVLLDVATELAPEARVLPVFSPPPQTI